MNTTISTEMHVGKLRTIIYSPIKKKKLIKNLKKNFKKMFLNLNATKKNFKVGKILYKNSKITVKAAVQTKIFKNQKEKQEVNNKGDTILR